MKISSNHPANIKYRLICTKYFKVGPMTFFFYIGPIYDMQLGNQCHSDPFSWATLILSGSQFERQILYGKFRDRPTDCVLLFWFLLGVMRHNPITNVAYNDVNYLNCCTLFRIVIVR